MRRRSTLLSSLRISVSSAGERRFSEASADRDFLRDQRFLAASARSQTQPQFSPPPSQEYDVLYENQRGFYFLGFPKFSPNLLNPLDPPAWCDRFGKGISTDLQTYPLPDPTWEWVNDHWLVDMSGDVDPNGWQYAFRFRQHSWRGESKVFHNFVRRRRWIRLRRKKSETELLKGIYTAASLGSDSEPLTPTSLKSLMSSDTTSIEPMSTEHETSEITKLLIASRVDREKIAIIQEVLSERHSPFSQSEVEDIMSCLEYDASRKRLNKILSDHSAACTITSPVNKTVTSPPPPSIESVHRLSGDFINSHSQLILPSDRSKISTKGTTLSHYSDARSFLE